MKTLIQFLPRSVNNIFEEFFYSLSMRLIFL